jgi:ATP-dependent RNA helicase DDX21
MLDMGFQQDLENIQKYLSEGTRSMIFSATVPTFVQELARKKFKDPILLDLVGNDTNQVPDRIKNTAVICESFKQMFDHVKSYITSNKGKKILIFSETK